MSNSIEITGLDELIKTVEELSTGVQFDEATKKALKRCLELSKPTVQALMRVSKDVSKSGWSGHKTYTHAKDNLTTKIAKKNEQMIGVLQIDNGKSNDSHAYYNFDEFKYGNSKYPPSQPFQKSFKKLRKQWDEIFEDEYTKLLKKLES